MAESIFSIGGIAALFGAGMRVGVQGHFDVVAVLLCLIAGCLLGIADRL